MIRLLPFILIPILIIGGLGYWRYNSFKQSLIIPQTEVSDQQAAQAPVEVPKTLPGISSPSPTPAALVTPQSPAVPDARVSILEGTIAELKARISALEKAPAAPATSGSKSTVYIPLGSGGQTSDQSWASLNTFQINLDPSQYPDYKSMQLEVNMRLNQPGGTLYARLYNSSGGSAVSSEISTTSTSSQVLTSSGFTLSAGSKTYVLQAKTADGSPGFLDYARIKVSF